MSKRYRAVAGMLMALAVIFSAQAHAAENNDGPSQARTWLVRDWNGKDTAYLMNFRTMGVAFGVPTREKVPPPSREGLSSLRVSGSGQPSAITLNELKRMMKGYRLLVLDLREEPHGFANGLPVSWYRGENDIEKGKTPQEIEADEKARLAFIEREGYVETFTLAWPKNPAGLSKTGVNPMRLTVDEARSENNLCALMSIGYVRIPAADYRKPSDENVDRFVALVKGLDESVWMHVHCDTGRVRTTTFLAMLDMIHNAKDISLEDIVNRQWLMGGINLFSGDVSLPGKDPYAVERAVFIRDFYLYCRETAPDFNELWSSWSMRRRNEAPGH